MLLLKLVETEKKIKKYQKELYGITKDKGLQDPVVLTLSKKLDKEIFLFQKLSQFLPRGLIN